MTELQQPHEKPRQADASLKPCELVKYHAPTPTITEFHHSKPVYLQNRLYGRIVHAPDLWVCSNCHEAIHAWLYWLMGERKKPAFVNRQAKKAAQATYDWYLTEWRTR